MIEMTLFLGILMPLSIRWMVNRWHAAIHLHRFIHVVYFVDIVRRHSHPHSWILNTPVFVLFYLDKWLFSFLHKRNNLPEIKRVPISHDFMVLYWKSPFGMTDTVGPDYALRLHGTSILEDKHVFTCFENRLGVAFNDDVAGNAWHVGTVIRVFRQPRLPRTWWGEQVSHTQRMLEQDGDLRMLITGPRQGEMSELIKFALHNDTQPVVLVGTGSAVNFLLDALQYCATEPPACHSVQIVYSTRDLALFSWCWQAVTNLWAHCVPADWLDVTMAYTGPDHHHNLNNELDSSGKDDKPTIQTGRVDWKDCISAGSLVFCQGSGSLKNAVQTACGATKATFHGGLGGGS